MGLFHVNLLSGIPEVDFVGVHDLDAARTREIAARYGVKPYDDLDLLLGDCDALSVCVPTSLHSAIGRRVLEKGLHVLIEKPLTQRVEDAAGLVALAKERGRILHVGHVERYNGAVQELQHIIDKPYLWESRRMGPNSGRIVDCGVVMDLMIHDLDICLRTVKSPVVAVQGQGNFALGSPHEDAASALVAFENGCVATFTASRVTQEKIRTLSISQKESYVTLDFTTQDLQIHRQAASTTTTSAEQIRYKQEAMVERVFVHRDNPLRSEIVHFIRTIQATGARGDAAHRENLTDLETLRVAAEILRQVMARRA